MSGRVSLLVVGSSAWMLGCIAEDLRASETGEVTAAVLSAPAALLGGPYGQSILQTGTAVVQDEDSFGDFTMADIDLDGRRDLVYIKRLGTGTGATEVHVVSAASGFQQFIQHIATGLSEAEATTGDVVLADVDLDGRPDLVFLKRRSTGTGTIELHAMSGASGFQQFIVRTGTGFSQAEDGLGDFTLADVDRDGRPDLVFIKSSGTGTGTVELHAMSGASGFQQAILHTGTAFSAVEGALGSFTLADVDRDGLLDLGFVKRRKTGSGAIEVHVASGASGFQLTIQQVASGFSQVEDGSGDFTLIDVSGEGTPDLVFIKRRDTGTATIELHALAG